MTRTLRAGELGHLTPHHFCLEGCVAVDSTACPGPRRPVCRLARTIQRMVKSGLTHKSRNRSAAAGHLSKELP